MIIFHSDLDNTLIYSYKHNIGPDKLCVENYQNREVSFISVEAMEILKRIHTDLIFVPTTTRTIEQYKRICFHRINPKYALVCNGGILLTDGQIDYIWYEQSLDLISSAREDLKDSIKLLDKDQNRSFEVRFIEELFVYTKSREPQKTVNLLRTHLDNNEIDVLCNNDKIYVMPKKLSKGDGIKRLKKILNPQKIISAGDSLFDVSMLKASDLGLCPQGLMTDIQPTILEFSKETFTLQLLKEVERQIKKTVPNI